MESLESISPLTVRLVFHLFLYFEMSLHVVGFVVSSIFFIVFSRLRSIHTNLIIILDSFVLSFCVTSVWRVYYCLKLLILNIEPGDSALTLGTDMRDTCMYVGGLHMLLLAGERLVATIRSRTYENESHVPHICVTVCGMCAFSYLIVFCLRDQVITNFLAAFIFLLIYAISIALMLHVRRANLRTWKTNRGTLDFSQNYQVHENVISARYLHKCFVLFAIQAIIGWSCLVIYLVFKRVYKVPILEKFFGFIFDVMLAAQTTTIPLSIVRYNEKLRRQVRRVFAQLKHSIQRSTQHLIDLEGNNMKIETLEETKAYFEQLKAAWS